MIIRTLFTRACVNSTFFTVAICLIGIFDGYSTASIRLKDYLFVLLFSFILALANGILSVARLKPVARRSLHYLLCLGSFFGLALVTGKIPQKGSSILIFLVLFTAVYIALYLLKRLFAVIRLAILK